MRVNIQVVKPLATIALDCPPVLAGALLAATERALAEIESE